MTNIELIPNTLRLERKKAGLRQIDVAKFLGLQSTDRISRWENGETFPHVTNLFKLSTLYGVPPSEPTVPRMEHNREYHFRVEKDI